MKKTINYLGFIFARKDSRFIENLNTQKIGLKPLYSFMLKNALNTKQLDEVYVSTDAEEILDEIKLLELKFSFKRPKDLSKPDTTYYEIINHFMSVIPNDIIIKNIILLPANFPLINSNVLEEAILQYQNKKLDTLIGVQSYDGLIWDEKNKNILNKKGHIYNIEGGFSIINTKNLVNENLYGNKIEFYHLEDKFTFNIRSYEHLRLARLYLQQTRIVIHFIASSSVGFGHYYRSLELAHRLSKFEIILICSKYDEKLIRKISNIGYKYYVSDDIEKILKIEEPDIIINDILNTDQESIRTMKKYSKMIVNFEDMGDGQKEADLVFNALYENSIGQYSNIYTGKNYAVLPQKFLFQSGKKVRKNIKNVMVSFGGSDPSNLTKFILKNITKKFRELTFTVIIGPGYKHSIDEIYKLKALQNNVEILINVSNMQDIFQNNDLALLSGGRTVFEAAISGVPSIVICQNKAELNHDHARIRNGIINLGVFNSINTEVELENIMIKLQEDFKFRKNLIKTMKKNIDGLGIFRIIGLIEKKAIEKGIKIIF